jgi:hypothetical protein
MPVGDDHGVRSGVEQLPKAGVLAGLVTHSLGAWRRDGLSNYRNVSALHRVGNEESSEVLE